MRSVGEIWVSRFNGNKASSPAKMHTAVLETHSPADGTQPSNVVLNCNLKVLFKITLFLERVETLMHPNKICYGKSGHSVPIGNCICEKPTTNEAWPSRHFLNTAGQMSTAVFIYIAGLCAKLPGCVEGHTSYWNTTAVVAWTVPSLAPTEVVIQWQHPRAPWWRLAVCRLIDNPYLLTHVRSLAWRLMGAYL